MATGLRESGPSMNSIRVTNSAISAGRDALPRLESRWRFFVARHVKCGAHRKVLQEQGGNAQHGVLLGAHVCGELCAQHLWRKLHAHLVHDDGKHFIQRINAVAWFDAGVHVIGEIAQRPRGEKRRRFTGTQIFTGFKRFAPRGVLRSGCFRRWIASKARISTAVRYTVRLTPFPPRAP